MQRFTPPVLLFLSAAALVTLIGYKSLEKPVSAARSDAQIAGDIKVRLSTEPALSRTGSPNVHVAVTNGVATLSGQVANNQTRLMASTDASKVSGVREVVNDLTLTSAQNRNQNQSQSQNTSVCAPPHRAHHRIKAKTEHAPELASNFVPPAPAPAPEPAPVAPLPAPPYPPCACVPMVVLPAPVMVLAPPVIYAYGFPPAVGIYARPGWVRPYPYARPFAYARPAGRPFAR